jgi:hypothetical protein
MAVAESIQKLHPYKLQRSLTAVACTRESGKSDGEKMRGWKEISPDSMLCPGIVDCIVGK